MGVSTGGGWDNIQGVVHPTRFGTYIIQNGWYGGMESALHGMSQANMDLGLFKDTNIKKSIYTREYSGYRVVTMEEPIMHSGGITVFYRAAEHFSIEALQTYGANVVNFQLASGNMWCYIVGY